MEGVEEEEEKEKVKRDEGHERGKMKVRGNKREEG